MFFSPGREARTTSTVRNTRSSDTPGLASRAPRLSTAPCRSLSCALLSERAEARSPFLFAAQRVARSSAAGLAEPTPNRLCAEYLGGECQGGGKASVGAGVEEGGLPSSGGDNLLGVAACNSRRQADAFGFTQWPVMNRGKQHALSKSWL